MSQLPDTPQINKEKTSPLFCPLFCMCCCPAFDVLLALSFSFSCGIFGLCGRMTRLLVYPAVLIPRLRLPDLASLFLLCLLVYPAVLVPRLRLFDLASLFLLSVCSLFLLGSFVGVFLWLFLFHFYFFLSFSGFFLSCRWNCLLRLAPSALESVS